MITFSNTIISDFDSINKIFRHSYFDILILAFHFNSDVLINFLQAIHVFAEEIRVFLVDQIDPIFKFRTYVAYLARMYVTYTTHKHV